MSTEALLSPIEPSLELLALSSCESEWSKARKNQTVSEASRRASSASLKDVFIAFTGCNMTQMRQELRAQSASRNFDVLIAAYDY